MTQKSKAELLRRLHHAPEVLVLPNAWDAISARIIAAEGFPVIATSSSGCAAVLGYPDGQQIPRSEMIFMLAKITRAVDVPVTADMEAGYDSAVETALDVIAAGAAGLNLEDRAANELQPVSEQVERIRAVRRAADSGGVPLVINARTDIFLAQHGDPGTRFERSVERLNAYREAGADCLFVPGVKDPDTIARLVKAVKGPVNILAVPGAPSIPEMKQLGVARVSLGGGPSRVAVGALRQFARELRDRGTFAALADLAIPSPEVQKLLSRA
jgi:2-methylisocitrate lyase-like PEP mutase family enzyme